MELTDKIKPVGLFVTGTDTAVGKTAVAAAIVRLLTRQGVAVGVYKPVATGVGPDGLEAGSDAHALWEATGRRGELAAVCPQHFATPIAPPRSARAAGRAVDERLLVDGLSPWRDTSDLVIVEGAGGLFSPLGEQLDNAELARRFGLPLVLVDAARLGAIGRTRAAVRAAESVGLHVAAVVLSQTEPVSGSVDDPASAASISRDSASDIQRLVAPVPVAMLRHAATEILPQLDWQRLAGL